MFEKITSPLLPLEKFFLRVLRNLGIGLTLIAISLYLGMCGYHYFEGMTWTDAFLNAAMILSGMGPVVPLNTEAGKIFAGCYALYSGLLLIAVVAIILAPAVHRLLHQFYSDTNSKK